MVFLASSNGVLPGQLAGPRQPQPALPGRAQPAQPDRGGGSGHSRGELLRGSHGGWSVVVCYVSMECSGVVCYVSMDVGRWSVAVWGGREEEVF